MPHTKTDRVAIGTSGFGYDDWLGNFYPQFCPRADYLRFYAAIFKTVEIDATYYRIPGIETVKRWRSQTPDDFIFTAKFPSGVTHQGSFEERLEKCRIFLEHIGYLGDKLGPLLMQFPYGFKPGGDNFGLLQKLIETVPDSFRVAVELRNRKWLDDELYDLLKRNNITLVQVDHPWMPRKTDRTGGFTYIRLLGDRKKIASDFSFIRDERLDDLRWWSKMIDEYSRDGEEVYVYVNNHYTGHSPSTARRLIDIIKKKD